MEKYYLLNREISENRYYLIRGIFIVLFPLFILASISKLIKLLFFNQPIKVNPFLTKK